MQYSQSWRRGRKESHEEGCVMRQKENLWGHDSMSENRPCPNRGELLKRVPLVSGWVDAIQ